MNRQYGAESGVPDPYPATSPTSSQTPCPPHHASSGDPRSSLTQSLKHLGSPIASGSGSGSSSSKLPQWFGSETAASLSSRIHTSNTSLTTPNLVESPRPISPAGDGKRIPLSAVTGVQAPSPGTSPPSQADSPPIPADCAQEPSTSSSSDEQLPTRASIRAWAKATPAGPPRYSPSPWGSTIIPQSSSDENLDDRQSITRSAGHHTVSSVSQERTSGSGSGVSSSDEDDSVGSGLNMLYPDDSSGNIADIDSSGSGGEDASPRDTSDPSPSASPSHRELLAPAPLHPTQPQPHPPSQTHPESSASESPPPAPVLTSAQIQEQQDRIDRRVDRHPPHHQGTTRRRHREHRDREHRERRSRPSNPTPSSHAHSQPQSQPQSRHGHSTLPPLRLIPDLRLPVPPPPLRPLRPLQVSSGGGDVLDDISRMLHFSRRPLLRTGVDPGGTRGASHSPPRNNDVLEDICFMIHMSRGR